MYPGYEVKKGEKLPYWTIAKKDQKITTGIKYGGDYLAESSSAIINEIDIVDGKPMFSEETWTKRMEQTNEFRETVKRQISYYLKRAIDTNDSYKKIK